MKVEKVGFFENCDGEKSWTRLINTMLFLFILGMWGLESWSKQTVVSLDPKTLGLLVASMTGSGINKWLELNGNKEKAKMIKHILTKYKAKK